METYKIANLEADLKHWAAARFLNPVLYIEGGWEYWIQIDFPAWLDTVVPTPDKKGFVQFDFRREVPIPGGRLDWLINSKGQDDQGIAIEIKAQSHKYLTKKFVNDVASDIGKLKVLGKKFQKIMLAAVVDPSAQQELKHYGLKDLCSIGNGSVGFMILR